MHAPNWGAAVLRADQLVIVSNIREDTALSAGWLAQALQRAGREELLSTAVTVLSAPVATQHDLHKQFRDHFAKLTRAVFTVPFDPALDDGRPIDYNALSDATHEAWLEVAAAVADGLCGLPPAAGAVAATPSTTSSSWSAGSPWGAPTSGWPRLTGRAPSPPRPSRAAGSTAEGRHDATDYQVASRDGGAARGGDFRRPSPRWIHRLRSADRPRLVRSSEMRIRGELVHQHRQRLPRRAAVLDRFLGRGRGHPIRSAGRAAHSGAAAAGG